MPDLLFELFCEEIPARMQRRAAADLKAMVGEGLAAAGLTFEGAYATATPRRLALHITGIPVRSPDRNEERKGPRVGAPKKAVEGFLRAAGLASIDEAEIQSDPKKGDFYLARITRPGRAAVDILAELLPDVVRRFPWQKSMRWGAASAEPGALRWVRPLHAIVCTFGPETEEPEIASFELPGIPVGDTTCGHRFMAPDPIRVRRMDDYARSLFEAKVVIDIDRRKDIILHDARDRALALGFELVEDPGLLEEVAGLVEWPVVLVGRFEEAFLDLPDEVIRLTIRENQKCFVMRVPEGEPAGDAPVRAGRLANAFALTANIEATDGGTRIVAGNERVVRARLSDARFFFETDRQTPLETHARELARVTFHEKLGSQGDRIERVGRLAREIAAAAGAEPERAERAAWLAKADLITSMVGEFPELQGYIGRRYAEAEGLPGDIAAAIEEHYKPLGPSDNVPSAPVSVSVGLADKIDLLAAFWVLDEKPTGSKDPYALRRAALGLIRLLLENHIHLKLTQILPLAIRLVRRAAVVTEELALTHAHEHEHFETNRRIAELSEEARDLDQRLSTQSLPHADEKPLVADLTAFIADRLKVQLREQGARHDLVDAVFALGGQDDIVLIVRRIEALARFLGSDHGQNLLAGYRRAVNILRIEEKKDAQRYDWPPDASLLAEPAEKALAEAIAKAKESANDAVACEDFEAAMDALSLLRAPVDSFFDDIMVNADDARLRDNRLRLLNEIREATRAVADFSEISG